MTSESNPAATGDTAAPTAGHPQKLLTTDFALAWLVNFVQYLAFYTLVTTVALYAVRQFAASDAASGFASSAFVVGATVARLFSGYIVDRFGSRAIMVSSLAVVVIACGLYIPAGSLPLLIGVRLLHGFAYAIASTAVMAIVQQVIPDSRRAEGTGYFALGTTFATAVGPALGLFLVGNFTYDVLIWTTFITAIIGLALGLLLKGPKRDLDPSDQEKPRFSLKSIAHPAVIPIGIFMLLIGLSYSGVITYLNAYSEERGLVTGAGLFFVAYALSMLIMRLLLGKVQDVRGDNIVIYFGVVFFALALLVLAAADANWMVVVAGAMTGLGYGTLMPAAQAIAVSSVPTHQLGTGISTLLLLADVGIGLGPIFLGFLVSATGYGPMYAVLAVVVALATVWYAVVHGRKDVAKRGRTVLAE